MSFPINPPNAPLVDANGLVTNEWYRFFRSVHVALGGPSDPFDDALLLAAMGKAQPESGDLIPPVPFVPPTDGDLLPASSPLLAMLVDRPLAPSRAKLRFVDG